MKPALTRKGWIAAISEIDRYANRFSGSRDEAAHVDAVAQAIAVLEVHESEGSHHAAALCLYNQPFGFTRDDVEMLKREAEKWWVMADPGECELADRARAYDSLTDRIEALLPPEDV